MQNHKAKREKAKRRSKLNSHTFCVLSMLPTHLHHMRKAGTIDWVPVSSNHMAKTAPPRAKSKNQIILPRGQLNLSKALPTGQE